MLEFFSRWFLLPELKDLEDPLVKEYGPDPKLIVKLSLELFLFFLKVLFLSLKAFIVSLDKDFVKVMVPEPDNIELV